MERLITTLILFMILTGCKSHKESSKSETNESAKSEQELSKVDSSSSQINRTYEEAIQWNYDRGAIIRFDSLRAVIEPSGIISANGYGARVDYRGIAQALRQIISTEQISTDSVSRTNESKTETSERTEITQEKEVKRGFPFWIMVIVVVLAGITAVAFYLFENFQPFKSLLKWIIKTLGRKS